MDASGTKILLVGESLVDIVSAPDGRTEEHVGGSPANVALTLARLGRQAALLTTTGDDERGARIRQHLRDNGVQLLPDGPTDVPTSTAAATLGEGGQATYEFELAWQLAQETMDGVQATLGEYLCVHTGSIAAVLAPGAEQAGRLLDAAASTATISYDPNARPAIMGSAESVRPHIEAMIARADLVKLSDEDAGWLYPDVGADELAGRVLEAGPSMLVLTRGGDGAVAWCGAGRTEIPSASVAVADTVGAGDSFSGALIDGLARQDLLGASRREDLRAIPLHAVREALDHAAAVAAITVSRPGADPPRRDELDKG
jgi:fructokinase